MPMPFAVTMKYLFMGFSVRGKLYLYMGSADPITGQSFPRTAGLESVLQAFFSPFKKFIKENEIDVVFPDGKPPGVDGFTCPLFYKSEVCILRSWRFNE